MEHSLKGEGTLVVAGAQVGNHYLTKLNKQAMIIIARSNLIMVSSSLVHSLGSNKGI